MMDATEFDPERCERAASAGPARRAEHAAHCAVCALGQVLATELTRSLERAPDYDARRRRIADAAFAASAAPARPSSVRRIGVRGWLLAAALLGLATAAAAAVGRGYRAASHAPGRTAAPAPLRTPAAVVDRVTQLVPAPPVAPAATQPAPIAVAPAPLAPPSRVATRFIAAAQPPASAASADELLGLANAARRADDGPRFERLAAQLQARYPDSRQSQTVRYALARWLLDRRAEPARALALLDRFLASGPPDAMVEPAMVARATTLGRLGRRSDERAAWRALLAAQPGSIHAEQARARLDALR